MIYGMVRIQVEDFDRFWDGFQTRGFPLRQSHGSRESQIFRHADDPHRVTLLFQWESREAFEAFFDDPNVKESIKKGGASLLELTVLDKIGELAA